MPRETKDAKAARQAAEQIEHQSHAAIFKRGIPLRMMNLNCRASSLGLYTNVTLDQHGPVLSIKSEDLITEYNLSSNSEEWQFDSAENFIRNTEDEALKKIQQRELAEDAWRNMPDDVRCAIIENIIYLRGI